eukprot:gene22382-biopygen8755
MGDTLDSPNRSGTPRGSEMDRGKPSIGFRDVAGVRELVVRLIQEDPSGCWVRVRELVVRGAGESPDSDWFGNGGSGMVRGKWFGGNERSGDLMHLHHHPPLGPASPAHPPAELRGASSRQGGEKITSCRAKGGQSADAAAAADAHAGAVARLRGAVKRLKT